VRELGLGRRGAVAERVGDGEAGAREVGGEDRDAGGRGLGARQAGEALLGAAVLERVEADDAEAAADGATVFDFGEWKTPVASRKNPDGTVSFLTTVTGFQYAELVAGSAGGKRTLVFRDAQHEYTFTEG